jgi:hypothetical protein
MTADATAPAVFPLAAYLAACYRVFTPNGTVTLRMDAAADPDFAAAGPWAIVSAANPGSWPASHAANAARHAELIAMARALGCTWHPARNSAADGSWPEESVALRVSAAQADGIARHYGQAASVFVPMDGHPRLRCLRPDWRLAAHSANMDARAIDWLP